MEITKSTIKRGTTSTEPSEANEPVNSALFEFCGFGTILQLGTRPVSSRFITAGQCLVVIQVDQTTS